MLQRKTRVISGRLALRESRLQAAKNKQHGLQLMTFEQAAVRLAGGFVAPIDNEHLRAAVQTSLLVTPMGELESIKTLPGMVSAAMDTLTKVWRAGIDLAARRSDHPRIDALAKLESAVLSILPPNMKRPADIVDLAISRISHASTVLGPVEIVGVPDLSPVWRPLLGAIYEMVPVIWNAGTRKPPEWLREFGINIQASQFAEPSVRVVGTATAYHEAKEAMRWARELLAGGVKPGEIAFASSSTGNFDEYFLALHADANIDLHFVHGVPVVSTSEGQAAAALADILVRGISQHKLRRLLACCKDAPLFQAMPEGWVRVLPKDAPLANQASWQRFFSRLKAEDWPEAKNHTDDLKRIVDLLMQGHTHSAEVGDAFLKGRARQIWKSALQAGPTITIDASIAALKQDDGLDPCGCIAWMPASSLAASPRKYVWLLGLNSSTWPRGLSEDRLIPNHIIPTAELDPYPLNRADRLDFEAIVNSTEVGVVLSRARRGADGRLLGRSPLLNGYEAEQALQNHRIPEHAFSEIDRLMARPAEFADEAQAKSAKACWTNWRSKALTVHDGLIAPNHPLIVAALNRRQSASSLKQLLRNPIGFVWKYGFGWQQPSATAEPLMLEKFQLGDLVHSVLEQALRHLEDDGGLANATDQDIQSAVQKAADEAAKNWESENPIPPKILWDETLKNVRATAVTGLTFRDSSLENARAYAEIPFGGQKQKSDVQLPWDPTAPVSIPGTGFQIAGYIDRLDISGDGMRAIVRDYKTGKPIDGKVKLMGGSELQRCFYGFAVKALLGEHVEIDASLFYPIDEIDLPLEEPEAVLSEVAGYLATARASLLDGAALPGIDAGIDYDSLAFALPANSGGTYRPRKEAAVNAKLGDATLVWEAE